MAIVTKCEEHDKEFLVPNDIDDPRGPCCPECYKEWLAEEHKAIGIDEQIPHRIRIKSGGLAHNTSLYNADTGEELDFYVTGVKWSLDCGEGFARAILYVSAPPAELVAENVEIRDKSEAHDQA